MSPSTTATSPVAEPVSPVTETAPQTSALPANLAIFTPVYLKFLNSRLARLSPEKILEWALISLPNLYQTTAFGLTGLVILDMLSKICKQQYKETRPEDRDPSAPIHSVPLIFIDTLYHFDETVELANRAAKHYNAPMHVYKPQSCESREDFEKQNGERLWETDADIYDYLVKVEPARRAYQELNVQAFITGRRRSQGASRGSIDIIELDMTSTPPMLKLNPLASWDYDTVWAYVQVNQVPYNPLIDKGYKSIGDFHSTQPTLPGENERDGRWRGQGKTECGLHKDYLRMRSSYVAAKKRKITLDASKVSVEADPLA
ncbi:hypothetical protein HK104_010708 [Borealophlyctis nickersoniae]|nr:hypothetical protein HK104_010708 [Borealophlyctis nickersoniae]